MIRNRRTWRKDHHRFSHLVVWVCLIITPFLVLFLLDEAENLAKNFQSKKKLAKQVINLSAMQESLYNEDVNRSRYNMHHPIKRQKDGELWSRIYPYSVVDGGVHSVQELRSAIRGDPVVAKHYSNFNLDRARVIEARADGDFHVSYRIGEEIFWTKKRLKVAKGERLITDDTNLTRTRCANMLSEAPQGKTSPNEPAPEVLDEPLDPLAHEFIQVPRVILTAYQNPSGIPLVSSDPGFGNDQVHPPSEDPPLIPPVLIGGGPPGYGPIPPNPGPLPPGPGPIPPGPGPAPPGPIPPSPVPEPTTLLLLCCGLAGLWGFRKKLKR